MTDQVTVLFLFTTATKAKRIKMVGLFHWGSNVSACRSCFCVSLTVIVSCEHCVIEVARNYETSHISELIAF